MRYTIAVAIILLLSLSSTGVIAQTVTTDFNTTPSTGAVLGGFPSPRTDSFEGWTFTATASGNVNLILSAAGGANGSATDRFVNALRGDASSEMQSLRAGLGANFKLESVYIEAGFAPGTGPAQLRLIGLSSGVPVTGAQVDTSALPNSATGTVVDTSSLTAFERIDAFEVQVLGTSPEYLSIGIDNIVRSPAVVSNNVPTAASFTAATGPFEGLTYTFATSDFGYEDADGDPLASVLIELIPAIGTLYVDADGNNIIDPGEILFSGTSVSLADLNAGRLKYIQNGSTNTSFQFEVFDGTNFSSDNYVATLNVVPIPTVILDVSPTSRQESVLTANTITATLSNSYGADTMVNLTFSGTAINFIDYTVSNSSITIPAGSTSGTVTLSNINDSLFENDETVVVDIASVINGSESGVQQVTYTIVNDDPPPTVDLFLTETPPPMMPSQTLKSITIADENGGNVWVIARLSQPAGVSVTVPLIFTGTATGAGVDYAVSSSVLVISPGDLGEFTGVNITSIADAIEETDETIIVDMTPPTNAQENGVQQVTITIVDEDATAPVLNSLTRQNPSDESTNADQLTFRVMFDSNVLNVDATDFAVNGGSTAAVTNTATVTADSVFDITVSGGDLADFDGTVGLDLAPGQNISDEFDNALPDAEPVVDETYTLDNMAPALDSIVRQDPSEENTNDDILSFRATFDDDVQNVDIADFVINGSSTATVTSVVTVMANSAFDVTVSGGNLADFDGTVGLDLAPGQDIADVSGNPLPDTEPAVDETYTLDNTAPVVTINTLITEDTTPELSGTVDDDEATLELMVDGQTVIPTNNADGTWTLTDNTLNPLAFDTFDVVVTATDAVGNEGTDDSADELTISLDADGDGVNNDVENNAPNNGDGNNDGIPDAEQANVASLLTATGRGYMTLVLTNDACSQFEQVAAVDPAILPSDSQTVMYPFGLVEFSLPCENALVDVIFQNADAFEFQDAGYRKYAPLTPGDADTTAWYDFSQFAGLSGTTWTLDLADNRLGDATGDDGRIVDPGGPARNIEPLIVPVNQSWALLLLMLLVLAAGWRLFSVRDLSATGFKGYQE